MGREILSSRSLISPSLQYSSFLFLLQVHVQANNTQITWERGRPGKYVRQQRYLAGLDCECLMCHILITVHTLRVFFSRAGQSSRPPAPAEPWRPDQEKEMGLLWGAWVLSVSPPHPLPHNPLCPTCRSEWSVCRVRATGTCRILQY